MTATFTAEGANLDEADWWCSVPWESYDNHYQWYERDSGIDLLDLNEIESDSAALKFRTRMRDRTIYWTYISWGVFPDEYSNSTSLVNGETMDGSTKPKHFEIVLGPAPAPFADRTYYDTAYWILLISYACNFFWILGLPLMMVLFAFLLAWGFVKMWVDLYAVQNVQEDNPYYAIWTMDNWWLYPVRQFWVNVLLTQLVMATSLIPLFNVFFNLGLLGLIYVNMILL